MLSLKDYLEDLEHLPNQTKKCLEQIRNLDIEVSSSMNEFENNVNSLFSIAENMDTDELNSKFMEIVKDGNKTVDKADEKIQLIGNIQGVMNKYLKKLDQNLHEVKMELEADNSGITNIIEQRVLESEKSNTLNNYQLDENIFEDVEEKDEELIDVVNVAQKSTPKSSNVTTQSDDFKPSLPQHSMCSTSSQTTPSLLSYTLEDMGAGSSKIAEAASQAIIATQQLSQGRRTASLKASYNAVAPNPLFVGQMNSDTSKSLLKLPISNELAQVASSSNSYVEENNIKKLEDEIETINLISDEEMIDPNEPRYCICNEIAYGSMVACDNKKCPHEWYHYGCVGVEETPKGKWYCPQCITKVKSRKSRKHV